MWNILGITDAVGLSAADKQELETLLGVYGRVSGRNEKLRRYYEGDISPQSIGVETAAPNIHLDETCDWCRKAVTSVSERSRFDGFVLESGGEDATLRTVVQDCNIAGAYSRHVPSELIHGCMFATVGQNAGRTYVRFHTAETATATWSQADDRLASGLVVADTAITGWSPFDPIPTQLNMHLPGKVDIFRRVDANRWVVREEATPLDRPMMESFAYRATGIRPFGESRISKAVRRIVDDVIRTLTNMAVSGAFYSAPQKYLIGLTADEFDAIKDNKWATYIGSILLTTRDADGNVPEFGQLSAASPQPYIDMLRTYAMMFSAATGVPINSLGIVQDNPSSAEAIQAAREDICIAAEDLNNSSAESLRDIALMAMAVTENTEVDKLTDDQLSVMARFKDPSKPSIVSQANAYVQVAAVDDGFAGTDVFYEGLGFDQPTRTRIQQEKRRNSATATLRDILEGANGNTSANEGVYETLE